VPGEQTYAHRNGPPVHTMEFTTLSDPKEILARARKFAKQKENDSREAHVFSFPQAGLWSSLTVPVVPSLQPIARRMIQAPELFVARNLDWLPESERGRPLAQSQLEGELNTRRAEGIAALRYFKSAANIRLLKPLLNHPAFQDTASYPD